MRFNADYSGKSAAVWSRLHRGQQSKFHHRTLYDSCADSRNFLQTEIDYPYAFENYIQPQKEKLGKAKLLTKKQKTKIFKQNIELLFK